MTTKDFVVLVFFLAGIILFGLVGFQVTQPVEKGIQFVPTGLMSWLIGVTIDRFWKVA